MTRGEKSDDGMRGKQRKSGVIACTGISTRMWPQEETVTQDERGNRMRNGQKMVTQQIISFLP